MLSFDGFHANLCEFISKNFIFFSIKGENICRESDIKVAQVKLTKLWKMCSDIYVASDSLSEVSDAAKKISSLLRVLDEFNFSEKTFADDLGKV
ncbi:hypothetical protein ABWH93_07290 [Seohaeicola saemankumensis]|uniref:hypothetical protein n=1 Tax=Seohaeicola TaxID=481178 RepID=UPI0035CEC6E7